MFTLGSDDLVACTEQRLHLSYRRVRYVVHRERRLLDKISSEWLSGMSVKLKSTEGQHPERIIGYT